MSYFLPVASIAILLLSFFIARPSNQSESFFHGKSPTGKAPTLLTLVLSQVTTWIFARSLLNAAILGYYYGLWGTLAYAAYYLSFITGGMIIDSLRFRHGFDSVQAFLKDRFGATGTRCYNFVIGIRLVSEVFANLLVIGILFGATGSQIYTLAIIGFAVITLAYAALGGLQTSLKTDVLQMSLFMVVLTALVLLMFGHSEFSTATLLFKPFDITEPGPVLIAVALLQVWSYPMHDPVMMDRGFLADRATTRKSFLHAGWLATLCIILFGLLGVFAGANTVSGEDMNATLTRLLGETPMLLFSLALVISAMSTLDSTLSSASKLVAVDMKWVHASVSNGRLIMALFMLAGLGLVFLGNKDIFSAVAVSGTVSMYLTPVILFSLWGNQKYIPVWSYQVAFVSALAGAALYFTESSGHTDLIGPILDISHKYSKLLVICITVLFTGCGAFLLGLMTSRRPAVERSIA
ncbi:sodium:proline symporter [Endozoicomonadaceae bacterium StTr2]